MPSVIPWSFGTGTFSDSYPGTVVRNDAVESDWAPYTPEIQFNASTATPEPGTWFLMLGSLASLVFVARRSVKA